MWEVLTQDVSGWAVAGVMVILLGVAWLSGQIYPRGIINRMIEPYKLRAEEADKRAERWEAAWYKLYAAQQLRSSSETTAVNEMALTVAAAIERLRQSTGVGEDDDESVPSSPPDAP
jgi:hypothetical protein